jgi:hypothetical protein
MNIVKRIISHFKSVFQCCAKNRQNTGKCVCCTPEFHLLDDFGTNEEGMLLLILSGHFEASPFHFREDFGEPPPF